jgi:hypothetical protein
VAVQRSGLETTASSRKEVGEKSKIVFLGTPLLNVKGKAYDVERVKIRRKKHAIKRCKSW